ncbi:MAG: phosphate regulon sensor histidine kinase PhoR [Neisseria sp.]|nr:phosphate regulon sensor histidine kinase PhoR [Neisseria sp.]
MPKPLQSLLVHIFFLLSAALLAYPRYGWAGFFALWAALASVLLARQFYHIQRLSRWLDDKQQTLPQAEGMWGGIFNALRSREKTHQKRKQKLSQALQRFNRAAQAMPNGVLLLDKNRRIVWANGAAVEHLHLKVSPTWGEPVLRAVSQPELADWLANDVANKSLHLRVKQAGKERFVQLTGTPFGRNELLLITQDISEAERLHAMRTAFVANVSHELKTPLTVINGFAETLAQMPDLPASQRQEFLALMAQEGTRMQHLLNDLLTLSRLESGAEPEFVAVDLSALCQQVFAQAQLLSAGKHDLRAQIADGIWLNGVQQDLYSALSNILFNAVRYTPENGRIVWRLTRVNETEAEVLAQDTGMGIAAEHLPHLTDRFYRVDKGRSRQAGGTGLGLAICKHALALHGAQLHIASEVGKGSEFSVRLNVLPSADETQVV